MNWLKLNNIDYVIDKKRILSNINLTIDEGENITILGPNGSGKSTLIKLISRSIYPEVKEDSELIIYGRKHINIWEMRSKIGFVTNEIHERINPKITLNDLIISGFYGSIGIPINEKPNEYQYFTSKILLEKFGLIHSIDSKYKCLSDGQKRIALIIRALVHNPRILILDEPTINLDIKSYFILLEFLGKLTLDGVNLVIVTNNLESIIKETTRVILIKKGRIVSDGTPRNIINSEKIKNLFDLDINVMNINGYWRISPGSKPLAY